MRDMIQQAAERRRQLLAECVEELAELQRLADARRVDIFGFTESVSAKLRRADRDRDQISRDMGGAATSIDLVASVQLDQTFFSLVRQIKKELEMVRSLMP